MDSEIEGEEGMRGEGASEELHCRNVKRFRGGLVFKVRRLVHHSALGSKVMKKRRRGASCLASLGNCDEDVLGTAVK